MGRVISGREIMLFIAKFGLWNAYLETNIHLEDSIEFRRLGDKYDGFDEISYVLHNNGKYEIEVWTNPEPGKDGQWELMQIGDIFDEVNV